MKSFTYRDGTITNSDKAAIRGLVEVCPVVASVFVTGMVPFNRIGDIGVRALEYANTTTETPLFNVGLHYVTMLRFDPEEVWPAMTQETLLPACKKHASLLGFKEFEPKKFGFYESLFHALNLYGTVTTYGGATQHQLNAMTLFEKQVLPSNPDAFFSAFTDLPDVLMADRSFASDAVLAGRDAVWDKSSHTMTRDEISFIINFK